MTAIQEAQARLDMAQVNILKLLNGPDFEAYCKSADECRAAQAALNELKWELEGELQC